MFFEKKKQYQSQMGNSPAEDGGYDSFTRENSLVSALYRFLVDILGCLAPGILAIFSVSLLIWCNYELVNPLCGIENIVYHYQKSQLSEYGMFVFIVLAYTIGFVFYRRSLYLPDSVSQVMKTCNESFNSHVLTFVVYTFTCAMGSFQEIVSFFRKHTAKRCDLCMNCTSEEIADNLCFTSFEKEKFAYYLAKRTTSGGSKSWYEKRSFLSRVCASIKRFLQYITRGLRKTGHENHACERGTGEYTKNQNSQLQLPLFFKRYFVRVLRRIIYILLLLYVVFICCGGSIYNSMFLTVAVLLLLLYPIFLKQIDLPMWEDCFQKKRYNMSESDPYNRILNRCKVLKAKITKYPYEDYFTIYLKSRNIQWLTSTPQWSHHYKNSLKNVRPASKRIIESIKTRIRYFRPDKMRDILRLEAHIRLIGAIWYLTRILTIVCMFMTIVCSLLLCFPFEGSINSEGIQSDVMQALYANLGLFVIFCFLSYSTVSVLHYLRLKEVHFILETYYLLKIEFKNNTDFDFDENF